MKPTAFQYARLLEAAAQSEAQGEAAAGAYAERFLRFLRRRKEWHKRRRILEAFRRSADRTAGAVRVTVTSAHRLGEAEKAIVEDLAGRVFRPAKPVLTYRTDAGVIGGLSLHSDDLLYDATIARKLRDLRCALVAG